MTQLQRFWRRFQIVRFSDTGIFYSAMVRRGLLFLTRKCFKALADQSGINLTDEALQEMEKSSREMEEEFKEELRLKRFHYMKELVMDKPLKFESQPLWN